MRRLLDEEPWDAACIVFVSPDRLQHCLLEYVHPGHPRHEEAVASPVADRVRDVYRLLDRELASLVERTDDDDLVVLMSDHGHQPCTRALSMNKVLEHLGFLRFGRGSGLVNLLAWGRVRSLARVAYDRLGLHGRVAVPTSPIDWAQHLRVHERRLDRRGSLAQPCRPRAGGNGRRARTTSECATRSRRPCSSSPTRRPARIRSGACSARRRFSRGPTSIALPISCSARAALQPHACPSARRGGGLALG